MPYNGVTTEMAADAMLRIGECNGCFPCGKECQVYGSATITYNYTGSSPLTMSGTTIIGTFIVDWTCCPNVNSPIAGYESVTNIYFGGVTYPDPYPGAGTCLDAVDQGSAPYTGARVCGCDIGVYSGIDEARAVFIINGFGVEAFCPELDATVLLGEESKTYRYESEDLTVTVSVTAFGDIVEGTCFDNLESCFEMPPPPPPPPP